LLSVVPDRTYRITSKTDWEGKSFVLPDVTIGPDADTLIHASRKTTAPLGGQPQGSLEGWLDRLKEPCRASSYLTFGIRACPQLGELFTRTDQNQTRNGLLWGIPKSAVD